MQLNDILADAQDQDRGCEFTTEELIRGFGAADEDEVLFRCRFFNGIANADRVTWNDQFFNIKKVTPIGRRKGMELRCERIAT